jgi:hypothetical protein
MLLAPEFGYNCVIARFVPQQDVPGLEENAGSLSQEFDINVRSTTFEADFRFIHHSFAIMQDDLSLIARAVDGEA